MEQHSQIADLRTRWGRLATKDGIRMAMRGAQGHVGRAAKALGIDRRKVKQYVADSGMSDAEWENLKEESLALAEGT